MSITIFRCLKKPGFIDRARMYFLELNNNGLYIIALGKATAVPNVRSSLQQAIAAEAINYFQDKYEPEIVANEKRIAEGQLETMKSEKHCYFLTKSQVEKFSFAKEGDGSVKIKIKGPKVDIALFADAGYLSELQEMEKSLKA